MENNKLIAEFMGGVESKYNIIHFPLIVFKQGKNYFDLEELKFHSDWNWLMEVVIKCRTIQLSNKNKIADIYDALHNTDIEAVYNAVVEFIEWYNLNNS